MQVELFPYTMALRQPVRTSGQLIADRTGLLLRIEQDGVCGWGDAAPLPGWPGGDYEAVAEALRRWQESVHGHPTDLRMLRDLPVAQAAIDTALADHRARCAGVPLAAHLSPAAVGSVAANALIDLTNEAQVEHDALRGLDQGFGTFKAKVGVLDAVDEHRLLARLRSSIGVTAAIRIDANRAWSASEAADALTRLAPVGIEYVEEPTADLSVWPTLSASTGIPIAADESGASVDLSTLVQHCSVAVVKVPVLGGPTAALATAQQFRQAGLDVVVTSFLDNAVGVAAALHTAAALGPVGLAHGLATGGRLVDDVGPPLPVSAGRITVPTAPGLGFDPKPRAVP